MRNISEILVLVIFQKIQIKQHVNADTFLQKSPFKFQEFDFHNCKYALKELVVGIILRQLSLVRSVEHIRSFFRLARWFDRRGSYFTLFCILEPF